MLESLVREAQVSIDEFVSVAAKRALVLLPFLVAVGFGAAGLFMWLARDFGAEVAALALAGIFCAIGLVAALVLRLSLPNTEAPSAATAAEAPRTEAEAAAREAEPGLSATEQELLAAGLRSALPFAAPALIAFGRSTLRNLPLLATVIFVVLLLTRFQTPEGAGAAAAVEPVG